ncbi:hypothetical protein NN561_018964 [Cricetulus griseus]
MGGEGGASRDSSEGGGVPDAHGSQAEPLAARGLLRGASPGPAASGALWVGRPCCALQGNPPLSQLPAAGGPVEPPSGVRESRPRIDVSSKTAPLTAFPPQS